MHQFGTMQSERAVTPAKTWFGKLTTLSKVEGQRRQATGLGPSSRKNSRELRKISPGVYPEMSLAEGVEMTRPVALRAWPPFDLAQGRLGAINFP